MFEFYIVDWSGFMNLYCEIVCGCRCYVGGCVVFFFVKVRLCELQFLEIFKMLGFGEGINRYEYCY